MARKRSSKLEHTVALIQRRYGPQALSKGRPYASFGSHDHVSTGFRALDQVLGIGGLPRGRISEWVGRATSGKTTAALLFLAQAQAKGRSVAYIDHGRNFDADYAHRCGLDLSRLLVASPYGIEETLATTESLVHSNNLSALVLDSTDDMLWANAYVAHDVAQWLSRLSLGLARTRTVLLVLRDAPDARSPALSALAHYACIRLRMSRDEWIHVGRDIRGYKARVEIAKNKLAPAGRAATIEIRFNGVVRGDGL